MESLKIIRVQPKDGFVDTEFLDSDGVSMGKVRFPQALWNRFKKALEAGASPAVDGADPILLVKVIGIPNADAAPPVATGPDPDKAVVEDDLYSTIG